MQTLNGVLYFHLSKNQTTGILTSLGGLSSSSVITVTDYPHIKSENLAQISTNSSLAFNTTTYSLTLGYRTRTPITPIVNLLSPFMTFSDKTFAYSQS